MRAKFPWIEYTENVKKNRGNGGAIAERIHGGRGTEEGEKLVGGSKGKGEEGNGLYQTGRWSTFRFFSFPPLLLQPPEQLAFLPPCPRTLLNCLPLVFTPVPLRYGLSSG